MADPKITLEYTRTLIWPVFALMVLLVFQSDISGMISRGVELDILGVTVKGTPGNNLKELLATEERLLSTVDRIKKGTSAQSVLIKRLEAEKEQLLAENSDLKGQLVRVSLAAGEDPAEFLEDTAAGMGETHKDKGAAVASLALESEIQQNLNTAQMILAGPAVKNASRLELDGFNHILAGRWQAALDSFESAYEVYPDYHNVREITQLLRRNRDALVAGDQAKVLEVMSAIVERYSWGAPAAVINAIQQRLES